MVAAAPILYRPPVDADLPEVCGLIWRVFGETITADCSAAGRRAFLRTVSIAGVRVRMRGESFLVAETSGSIVGVASATPAVLSLLFVRPDFRRRGIARALIRESFQLYAGTPPRAIHVGAALGAVAMYEKLGFRRVGPRIDTNGMPAVPMRLRWSGKRAF